MTRVLTLVFAFFLSATTVAVAVAEEPLHFLFFYPGGEGDSADAQPVMDSFCALISKEMGTAVACRYENDKQAGTQLLKSWPADAAVLSLESWVQLYPKTAPELSTLPVGSEKAEDRYFLMMKKDADVSTAPPPLKRLSVSRPLSEAFLNEALLTPFFPTGVSRISVDVTSRILEVMKKISSGESEGGVLLDSFEYQGFRKLSLDWTRNLKLVLTTRAIPSSPFVVLTPKGGKLGRALMKIKDSKEGKEVLSSLRLKGFTGADAESYAAFKSDWEKAKLAAPMMPASSPN